MKQQDTFIQDDYTAGYLDGASAERLHMAELLKENKEIDHKSFNEHRLEIEKIVMGCIGVKSREVHWSEAIPMLAAYVVRNTNKQLLKEERNKAIQECITAMLNDQDILFNGSDILGKLESFKR